VTNGKRPAAYLCIAPGRGAATIAGHKHAIYQAVRQRGWPEPTVYLDQDNPGWPADHRPALAMLSAAISAGRCDTLLLAGLGTTSSNPRT